MAGRFGSVKAATRQVPVGAVEMIGTSRMRPPMPWSGTTVRRYSMPSERVTISVSGTFSTATLPALRRSAVTCTVSPVR